VYSCFSGRALGLDLAADEAIDLAVAAGFDAVDLPIRDLVRAGTSLDGLRARIDHHGLRGGTWPLPVDWRHGPDAFARDLERLDGYAGAAARLGLTRTGTWVLPETTASPDDPDAHRAATGAWHVARLGAIANIVGRHGIRLGLEVIGVASSRPGRGMPFVHRLAHLDRWLGALLTGAPNVGIVLDAFHLYAAGENLAAALAWGVERLVAIHVADLPAGAEPDPLAMHDGHRGVPGEHGAIDSRALLARLAAHGYDGPVIAEPMAGCRSLVGLTARQRAGYVAAALQSVWPSGVAARLSEPPAPSDAPR
jgi:sugar phosphate isomerase/epimerase